MSYRRSQPRQSTSSSRRSAGASASTSQTQDESELRRKQDFAAVPKGFLLSFREVFEEQPDAAAANLLDDIRNWSNSIRSQRTEIPQAWLKQVYAMLIDEFESGSMELGNQREHARLNLLINRLRDFVRISTETYDLNKFLYSENCSYHHTQWRNWRLS